MSFCGGGIDIHNLGNRADGKVVAERPSFVDAYT